jgi:hypothetical protein
MVKRGDKNKIIPFGLIMMGILSDAGADHVFMRQQNGLGLPGGA